MSITEEEFEEQVSELFINYLEKCTPEEIHQVVVEWNFDNPKKPIHWIANSTKTDKGTALMLWSRTLLINLKREKRWLKKAVGMRKILILLLVWKKST
ncbi:DUF4274 domain-containing protein [Listeria monocytogenes]|uniref:DUF4274 domain-containing protein n=1 Tax=Listeria monocytogenes TaxID=1639 RepID=UPI0002ECECB9|nr:DUF4274 domain-containing protein [Listeria monocytogenes]MCH4911653.1 DUF4274 domain-containing protein [Listeria monocytogenes]MCH4933977.1 DUF4274 domain-containing protein [Listeria monocytogenes]CUK42202.1 hypothetical protein LM500190_120007 [Listeria monocytogenes]CUL70511.1 hypothetical protein LM801408_180019 [Listeria monocytogenes]SCU57603.1 hypothetical protein LM900558_140020 [Listeria monocytogenes]